MSTIRHQRVAEMLFQELSILIANELDDPRVSLVGVTAVDVSRDLRSVQIYVNHDDEAVTKSQVLKGLKHAVPFLRREIASRCGLRVVPELIFHYDDTPTRAARIDELLQQIAEEDARRVAATPALDAPDAPGNGAEPAQGDA